MKSISGWQRHVALVAAAALASAMGCGGQKGTLTVSVVTPEGTDPFLAAATVRVTVGSAAMPVAQTTTAVSGGHFDVSVNFNPPMMGTPVVAAVTVEGLAADGTTVVARGTSPLLSIAPANESISVWVGPVGKLALSSQPLSNGRSAMAAASIPRLGPAFVGGIGASGASTEIDVYSLYELTMTAGAPLASPRQGAVAIGFDRDAATYSVGALLLAGGGAPGATPSEALSLFDPALGTTTSPGNWTDVAMDAGLARDGAAAATLSDGTVLLTGGVDKDGMPLATAAVVVPASTSAMAVTATMTVPRSGHTATPFALPSGQGALIFGGSTMAPSAEGYAQGRFAPLALVDPTGAPLPPRIGHTATTLADGRVLILGGREPSATGWGPPLATGWIVSPSSLQAQPATGALSTARAGHTATLVGDAVLVCGGVGAGESGMDGPPVASCDVVDAAKLTVRATPPLAIARSGHAAVVAETGVVLVAGGIGADGKATNSVEIYTP